MPDILGITLKKLLDRVSELELQMDGHAREPDHIHAPKDEVWTGGDFSI
jgi:hypothetical protein